MRLAVIFIGGTILCTEQSGYFAPSKKRRNELIGLLPPDVEAEVFCPCMILSEQLDGNHLTAIINEVGDRLSGDYDGIIVFHGTDTLQFSAAALSLAYGNADIPIVLVSSNYVLEDERSNGKDNLRFAVEFIRQDIGGVFVSYKNTGEKPSFFLGDTLLPHLPYSDALYSVGGAYGCFEGERFIKLTDGNSTDASGRFSLSAICPVLWIKAAAGIRLPDIEKYKAVMLETYHSGTLPTESESLLSFCKSCGKPIYIVGVSDGKQYSSTKAYKDLNLHILPPVSPVAAYISLWRKYSG